MVPPAEPNEREEHFYNAMLIEDIVLKEIIDDN